MKLLRTYRSIDIITHIFCKESAFFLIMFVFMSLFWDAFLGSRFSIYFFISSILVSLNLNAWDLFLDLINLTLGWFWYFPIIFKRGSSSGESEYSNSWFVGLFKIGILMKYSFSLNIFAICLSCEIIWLPSIKVILETFLDFSAKKGYLLAGLFLQSCRKIKTLYRISVNISLHKWTFKSKGETFHFL